MRPRKELLWNSPLVLLGLAMLTVSIIALFIRVAGTKWGHAERIYPCHPE